MTDAEAYTLGQRMSNEMLIELLTERAERGLCSEAAFTEIAGKFYEAAETARNRRDVEYARDSIFSDQMDQV